MAGFIRDSTSIFKSIFTTSSILTKMQLSRISWIAVRSFSNRKSLNINFRLGLFSLLFQASYIISCVQNPDYSNSESENAFHLTMTLWLKRKDEIRYYWIFLTNSRSKVSICLLHLWTWSNKKLLRLTYTITI